MITISSSAARLGDRITLDVGVDEEVIGVQFRLLYDSGGLSYVGVLADSGVSATVNSSVPDELFVLIDHISVLPFVVCRITFDVNGPSLLDLLDARGSTVTGQSIPLSSNSGEVTIIGGVMQVTVVVDSNPNNPTVTPELGLFEASVLDTPDPANDTQIESVPGDAAQFPTFEVLAATGIHQYWAAARNFNGWGPPSNLVSVDTSLPGPLVISVSLA